MPVCNIIISGNIISAKKHGEDMGKNEQLPVIINTADTSWIVNGRLLEQSGHYAKAVFLYEALLSKHPHNAYIYDRLMILYRKQKAYKKELALIEKALKKFGALLHPEKRPSSKIVFRLSKSILHSVGLIDKKGKPLYKPEPIARWEKREAMLKLKLANKK